MSKSIELIKDRKLLNDSIQGLGSILSSNARKEIIRSICSADLIYDTLERIVSLNKNEFSEIIMPKLTVSGAGMIKIRLLHNKNGEIRYHVFPKSSLPTLQKHVGGNCHVHDFQGYSYVLKGTIIEEGYNIEEMTEIEKGLYNLFLHIVVGMSTEKKNKMFSILENVMLGKEYELNLLPNEISSFLEKNNIHIEDVAKRHYVYNGVKRNDSNGGIIEEFEDIGTYGFQFDGIREVKAGERYFLPAERGHRVDTEGDTATFFVTDTTYQSQSFDKGNGLFLRGHGKRFPWLQEKIEKRSSSSYKLSNDELYKLVVNTTNEILLTM